MNRRQQKNSWKKGIVIVKNGKSALKKYKIAKGLKCFSQTL
jgi:hypothetical protein